MLRAWSAEGADAALAEDHLVVALAHDILGGHEELFEGGAEAALEQDGLAQLAGLLEQGEVLHVAGADLDDVGPLGDQFEGFAVEGFSDDAQAEAVANLGHDAAGRQGPCPERRRARCAA